MSDLRFTSDHEWIRLDADGLATVGITDYAQGELGDVVYVELPRIGEQVALGAEAAVIESVKAAAEVKSPASGTVAVVNQALADEPDKINSDPTGAGWLLKLTLSDPSELDRLMDATAYESFLAGLKS